MNKQGRNILLILTAILLFGCASQHWTNGDMRLFGMVYDDYNQPVGGAAIYIEDKDFGYTDRDGRFYLSGITSGKHNLKITKPLFETISVDFTLSESDQVIYLKLISVDSLKEKIETAVLNEDFLNAEALLKRAEIILPEDPVLCFLKAIIYFKLEEWEISLMSLYSLVESNPAYIEVFDLIFIIHDIYPDHVKGAFVYEKYESFLKKNN